MGSCQRYCNGKRFCHRLQRVTLIFTWFYSTKRFCLFTARLRCFQEYVSQNRLFLSSLPKLGFWPFILPEPSFCLVATKLEAWSIMPPKAAIYFFCEKTRSFKFHSDENRRFRNFEIWLLWPLYHKKLRLCIFVAKRRSTQLYSTKNLFWFLWRQTGLFPALLNR